MKYIVWGAGHRGKILFELLGKEKIMAYIDSNPEKIGSSHMNRPIIDYETYKNQYSQYPVIVALTFGSAVCRTLEQDGILYFNIEECPPEFMGYGLRTAQEYLKNFRIDIGYGEKLALFGGTLYTIEAYEKLCQSGYDVVGIILPKAIGAQQRQKIEECCPQLCMTNSVVDKIIVTDKRFYLEDRKWSVPVIDLVEWSNFIPGYYNEKIASLENKFKNKRCFIVATGPSIRYEDLDTLYKNREFCISINTIFKCFEYTKWRPNAYVILDAEGVKEYNGSFGQLSEIDYKFIADVQPYFDYTTLDSTWLVYHSVLDDYSIRQMLISNDAARRVYNGGSVVYACMQIAMYLGFKQIYLLGVDFSYLEGKKNHFIKQFEPDDIFDGMSLQNKIQEISYLSFCKARKYAEDHNIEILNATRGGYLDVFERADFDTLF